MHAGMISSQTAWPRPPKHEVELDRARRKIALLRRRARSNELALGSTRASNKHLLSETWRLNRRVLEMEKKRQPGTGAWVYLLVSILLGLLVAFYFMRPAYPRDLGQWQATDADIAQWFRELKQPDNPRMSCCGEADAYYADKVVTRNGIDYAIVTDTRDDAPLGRPHVDVGTEIEIPPHKYKWDHGNPTGHSVIFLSSPGADHLRNVYCFVDGGGV